ncbi:hypothetical protein AX15_003501 [Amanita polypyramis BW_CC]|nr:hypothetical protein AX15_003501 [Amanita polypyramis BW_CC]
MPSLRRAETAPSSDIIRGRSDKNNSVRINPNVEAPTSSSFPTTTSSEKGQGRASKKRRWIKWEHWRLPQGLVWIPANFTWSNMKPVIRCAIAAWVSGILFVIPGLEKIMGQGSFVILMTSFFSPPADPFMSVLERELLLLLLSTLAWAWCCLGIFLAWLARSNKTFTTVKIAISGEFLEAGPTAIIAIFIFLGTAFILFIRAKQGPGPYIFPCVLACLTLDTIMQTAVLLPFPYYAAGKSLLIPMSLHTAISLLCSIFIFPESMSSQYTKRLQGVLTPLAKVLEMHRSVLKTPLDSPEFQSLTDQINSIVGGAESALVPVSASARLLRSDLIYSRYAPVDFRPIQETLSRLVPRTTGMGMYFSLIDPTRERLPMTPYLSLPPSPVMSGSPSRQPSPEHGLRDKEDIYATWTSHESPIARTSVSRRRVVRRSSYDNAPSSPPSSPPLSPVSTPQHSHAHAHTHCHHRVHSRHLHHKLLHLKRSSRHEHVVGTFEVQKYLNLEASWLHTPFTETYTKRMLDLLQESCDPLLETCSEAVITTRDWLGGVFKGRFRFWVSSEKKQLEWQKRVDRLKLIRYRLQLELEHFRRKKRHLVLDPYKGTFDPRAEEIDTDQDVPPHRHLFHCYVYQYHVMEFGDYTMKMLDHIIGLEEKRRSETIWTPVQYLFKWSSVAISDNIEKDDEENPELIEGIEDFDDYGRPQKRDPDALPPSNPFELIADYLYYAAAGVLSGNTLYAIKAGVLTVLLFLPLFFKSSASFAYRQYFVWVAFMGQLSLSRFRGDTAFAFVSRIVATFFGGVIGTIMWYISAGSNPKGNAYGFVAVYAVCLPFFFYTRLYWPTVPITNIIMFVTVVLVIGLSYEAAHLPLINPSWVGFIIAWRRFVLVVVGVTAAYIFSFLPPSTTIRKYHRKLVSTTCSELGTIYCQIISFANSRRQTEVPEIMTNLLAIRRKLRKAQSIKANVRYELSFRGKWPAKRYLTILEIQLQIAFALSSLLSIIERLESAWSRAFLRRTRFNDMDFQGDILAVITMIATALRTGHALPQITPCPLLDRFMLRFDGLEVIHKESQDDYGLPKQLTMDTLKNEQYMCVTYCSIISTSFFL